MSQTNESGSDTDAPAPDGDTGADTIGIYYVPSNELIEEPDERTYRRRALWTPQGWSPTSNGEFVERAPDERTLDDFRDTFATRNYFVMTPENVPGTVEIDDPQFVIDDLNLDVPVNEDGDDADF